MLGAFPTIAYYQMEGLPIGSGPVESWVKQIDARLQVTGAQWNEESLPHMLNLRSLYLNHQLDYFFVPQRMTCSPSRNHSAVALTLCFSPRAAVPDKCPGE